MYILLEINIYNICISRESSLFWGFRWLDTPSFPLSLFRILLTLSVLIYFWQTLDAPQGGLFWSESVWSWMHKDTCRCHTETLLPTHHLFFLVLLQFLLSSSKFFKQLGGANAWSPLGSTSPPTRKPNLIAQSHLEYFFYSTGILIMLALFKLENCKVFNHTRWRKFI